MKVTKTLLTLVLGTGAIAAAVPPRDAHIGISQDGDLLPKVTVKSMPALTASGPGLVSQSTLPSIAVTATPTVTAPPNQAVGISDLVDVGELVTFTLMTGTSSFVKATPSATEDENPIEIHVHGRPGYKECNSYYFMFFEDCLW